MLLGKTEPRIYTPPLRPLTPETSAGFSVISFAHDILHIKLLPWQQFFLIHAFELLPNGQFRFRVILLEVARQNGKTTLDCVIVLWFMAVRQVRLVLGTAQTLDISEETWEAAVAIAEENDELSDEIAKVVRVNGKKTLAFASGSRYQVAAASRKGGRGKSADLVLLDEIREHQTWDAWGAVSKTTLARPEAVILATSNAGDSTSVVLRHLRAKAHAAIGDPDGWAKAVGDGEELEMQTDSIGIFEWSATPECAIDDRSEWAQANPSLGYGFLTERALEDALATDPEPVFRTECLTQWVETVALAPFPDGAWECCEDPASEIALESELFWAVDVSADRTYTSIAVCGKRPDGYMHVELAERRAGTVWPLEWFASRAENGGMTVAYQARGAPAADLGEALGKRQNIEVVPCQGATLPAWCGRFYDAVATSAPGSTIDAAPVYHRDQPVLDMAAKTAAKKPMGDGAFVFDRTKSPEDAAPIMACALAFGLATEEREPEPESAYEAHGMRSV